MSLSLSKSGQVTNFVISGSGGPDWQSLRGRGAMRPSAQFFLTMAGPAVASYPLQLPDQSSSDFVILGLRLE